MYIHDTQIPFRLFLQHVEPSWGHLGASWGHLGGILARLGAILGHLGAILAETVFVYERSEGLAALLMII